MILALALESEIRRWVNNDGSCLTFESLIYDNKLTVF